VARRGKTEKTTPEQKIISKLAKTWNMPCECSKSLTEHLEGRGCNKYTPTMSINLIQEA
jgi:hypothetical protein